MPLISPVHQEALYNLCGSQRPSAFLACRLITIDKCPRVRPIGICETARRIISKAVLFAIRGDIQDAAGSFQSGGTETEAVLLVDASNAFNSLNRDAALHNIRHVCPSLSTVLINIYRNATELFVDGSTLFSEEGTTQGDPLAMPMYAMVTIPLINQLGMITDLKQVSLLITRLLPEASTPHDDGGTT